MKRTLEQLERRGELESAREKAGDELARARARVEPLSVQRAEARAASRRFKQALAEVYRDPAGARRAFHARARRDGVAAAADELAHHPERFGELRGAQVGPVRSAERSEALSHAAKLEHLGSEHVRATREAWANRSEYREVRVRVAASERKVAHLDSELTRGTGSAQLQHRLGRQLRRLRPNQREVFQRSVPLPQRRVVTAVLWAGQAFAREQGHER